MRDQEDKKQLTEVRNALEQVDDAHGCGKVGALKKVAGVPFFSKYTFFDPDGKNRSVEKVRGGLAFALLSAPLFFSIAHSFSFLPY